MGFLPTLARAARLVHLSVVLDADDAQVVLWARQCDRARVDTIWLRGVRIREVASALAGELRHARLGAVLDGSADVPGLGTVAVDVADDRSLTHRLRTRDGTAGSVSVLLTDPSVDPDTALRMADDVVVVRPSRDEVVGVVKRLRERCRAVRRDPDTLGIGMQTGVAVGRTTAEAEARRATAPSLFVTADGAPTGIVGRLEDCQAQVVELAHAGITDLRCELAPTSDLPDLLGQLFATVAGSRDRLRPGVARSPDPDPPAGWGGPPRPR